MIGTEEILNNKFDILMSREILPQYTDYSLVNRWWHFGHEIASHSITHRNDLNYWKVKIVMRKSIVMMMMMRVVLIAF